MVFKYIRNKLLNFYSVIIFPHIELMIFIVRIFKCEVLITNELWLIQSCDAAEHFKFHSMCHLQSTFIYFTLPDSLRRNPVNKT